MQFTIVFLPINVIILLSLQPYLPDLRQQVARTLLYVSETILKFKDIVSIFAVLLSMSYRVVETVKITTGEANSLNFARTAMNVASGAVGFHCRGYINYSDGFSYTTKQHQNNAILIRLCEPSDLPACSVCLLPSGNDAALLVVSTLYCHPIDS